MRGGGRGFTLVEVLVAMAIFAVVMALAGVALVQAMNVGRDNTTRATAENQVREALSYMIPEIRQTGGSASGSGIVIGTTAGAPAATRLSFKTCTGFDVSNQVAQFGGTQINYWYDDSDPKLRGKIKRSTGTAPANQGDAGTVVAVGIDSNFQFQPTSGTITSSITIRIQSTKILPDGSTVTVTGTSTVSFFN